MPTASLLLLLACQPPPEAKPPPPVLIATWTDAPAMLPAVPSFESAWAHAPKGRPALAALLTGALPEHNGVRDLDLHGLAVPSLAHRATAQGLTTAAQFFGPAVLHPGESWGFGEAANPDILWIHGPSEPVLEATDQWRKAHPDGHAFLTTDGATIGLDADPIPLLWSGPKVGALTPAPVGQVDVAATIATLLDLDPEGLDGTDLSLGGSEVVVQEDARATLADGHATVRIERTLSNATRLVGSHNAPVIDLLPTGKRRGLPTDPHGQAKGRDVEQSTHRVAHLERVQQRIRQGRLRSAIQTLDSLERHGQSLTTRLLRASIDANQGHPVRAMARREEAYAAAPSAWLALQIAHQWLDQREPDRAAEWFDEVLSWWPDHPDALLGRLRCADLLHGSTPAELYAQLVVVAPTLATLYDAERDVRRGYPLLPSTLEVLDARSDPLSQRTRARAYWNQGDPLMALEIAQRQLEASPRDTALRLDLATWELERGNAHRAARLLAPVHQRFPDDLRVDTLFDAAKAALAQERYDLEALRRSWAK